MASKTIDTSNSEVNFQVKKLGLLTIKGTISDFTGEVSFSKEKLADAKLNVCVNPATINTGNPKRDEHLKSQDFFHVEKHPQICFQSTSVETNKTGYQVIGKLMMLGNTKEISIPLSFSGGVFTGSFSLNRLEYNLGKRFPAFFIGKTIEIYIKCKIK
jgi:polyisoprenoid-binding protein YceI